MNSPKPLIIILLILPGVCLMAAAFTCFNTADLLSRTLQTKAVVIDLHWTISDSGEVAVPVVRFADAQGVEHIAEGGLASNYNLPSIGDEMDILYDPDNPEGVFWTPSNVWYPTYILPATSLCFTAIGLFFLKKSSQG